jgi:ribosomal protein S2
MTILSTVCTKLLCTNAHLGRRVAAHHFKVYIRGSRNGIAILDSDKTLICLRNALHFIGSLIRQNGRSFFLKTNHFFIYLIMEKMIYSIMEKMGSCINDSQWKIGAFLTNSYANPKKFRSRKKKIHFGLNQQPDCVVIPNPDRKSSVILEANRSQIPIASLVDSTIPWESNKRITYPIPANDTIQFIYLFRHSITKTVILERPRITAMNSPKTGATHLSLSEAGTGSGGRRYCASASDPKGGNRFKNTFILFYFKCKILLSRVPPELLVFIFWILLSQSLNLFVFFESATAATGEIVVAHSSSGEPSVNQATEPSVNQPAPSFHPVEREASMDALMNTTSASSGEPSVNQAFHPVQNEIIQQQVLLTDISGVIQQQYLEYIIRHNPWMRGDTFLFGPNIMQNVQTIMQNLELELLQPAELEQFLQDIQVNPRQLHPFFKELWFGPGAK